MSNSKLETRKSKIVNPFVVDDTACRYLAALEHAEVLKKALLAMCRTSGFTPKDAPKTKLLAGKLYEVLAIRTTRMTVDQKAVLRLLRPMCLRRRDFRQLFTSRVVFDLQEGADRFVMQLPARMQRAFYRAVQRKWNKRARLDVRKRKNVARGSSPRRKAA